MVQLQLGTTIIHGLSIVNLQFSRNYQILIVFFQKLWKLVKFQIGYANVMTISQFSHNT
jgi:hypothetical protein